MKQIIIQDTSVGSRNLGDYIIMDYFRKQFKDVLVNNYVITYTSHLVNYGFKEKLYKFFKKKIGEVDYNFMCGTNAINKNLKFYKTPQWKINFFIPKEHRNIICVAMGSTKQLKKSLYSKILYKKILSKDFIHSTRDESTAEYLRTLGLQAINTSCVTLWNITNELCADIPTAKRKEVVFTLTNYEKNEILDKSFIALLFDNYEKITFWIQGKGDYSYLKSICDFKKINILAPSLEAYDEYLKNNECDYIGTRLHAGIRAVNFRRRTIILSVDNRANDMKKTSGLCIISRDDLEDLQKKINGEVVITPHINQENVKIFMDQFDLNSKI